jgi:hypothetical protein
MQVRTDFPEKKDFPTELQQFYLENHKPFHEFNEDFSLVCFLIEEKEIMSKKGIFSSYTGKRPDQVHYSIGLGCIEEKSTNYGTSRIEGQFSEFKKYFESKYSTHKICVVKYFILYANVFSDKLKTELSVKKSDNSLVYLNNKSKQYKINGVPQYFAKNSPSCFTYSFI